MQTSLGKEQEPDPSLAETTRLLKNLYEAGHAKIQTNKSKLADMAEANISGIGVLGNGQEQKDKEA